MRKLSFITRSPLAEGCALAFAFAFAASAGEPRRFASALGVTIGPELGRAAAVFDCFDFDFELDFESTVGFAIDLSTAFGAAAGARAPCV